MTYLLDLTSQQFTKQNFNLDPFNLFIEHSQTFIDYRKFLVAIISVLPIESEDKLVTAFDLFDCG